ncbi:MAG TPA: hypothetical protein VEH55_02140 [Gaiellaceae bacterium]|nr:hypothetical protein [Gaiellaceae bacterium]
MLGLVPSYAVLCAAQAAAVAAPARPARSRGPGALGVAVPAAALGLGVLLLRVTGGGPHALALLGAVAAPLLAAAAGPLGRHRFPWAWPPAALALWLVAWLASGLVAQAAGLLLIAGACLALAAAVGLAAPAWSIEFGLLAVAVVDVVLVWGTPQVEPASTALHYAVLPSAAGHPLPPLQDATFGSATMGWLDLLAPALLGVVARARLRAAVATGAAAGAWGLLLAVTSTLPATVPVVAGLLASRPLTLRRDARRRHL